MLSVRYRRERFTAGVERGGNSVKGGQDVNYAEVAIQSLCEASAV